MLDELATVIVEQCNLASEKDALEVSEGATINVDGGRITSAKGAVLDVNALHARHGPSRVTITGVNLHAKESPKIGRGNEVSVNGEQTQAAKQP